MEADGSVVGRDGVGRLVIEVPEHGDGPGGGSSGGEGPVTADETEEAAGGERHPFLCSMLFDPTHESGLGSGPFIDPGRATDHTFRFSYIS